MNELVETFDVKDIFASGLGEVEEIGGCYRFTLFSYQMVQGRQHRVVVARIVMPADALPQVLHMAARQTGTCPCAATREMVRH